MATKSKHSRAAKTNWYIVAIVCLSAMVVVLVALLLLRPPTVVSTYEQCQKARGSMMIMTYPGQCTIGGQSFTDPTQSVPDEQLQDPEAPQDDSAEYIGLTEADALAKAEAANVPAQVVEREGVDLGTRTDFVFNRHDLYVKDGKVYKVEIEGLATDVR